MTCNFDEMLLYEYLDDTLEPLEKIKVTNHLSACPHCRKKIADIKLLYYEFEHIEAVEYPVELEALRLSVVETAFKAKKKPLQTVSEGLKRSTKTLQNTPVVGHLIPTKAKLSRVSKSLYEGSKKVVKVIPKKEKPPKKKLKERLGGIL